MYVKCPRLSTRGGWRGQNWSTQLVVEWPLRYKNPRYNSKMELRERMQVCNFHFQLIVKALLLQIVTSMTRRSWSSLMKRKLIQVTLFRCKKKFNLQKEWNCSRLRKKAHRQIYSQVKGFSTNKRFVFLVGEEIKTNM